MKSSYVNAFLIAILTFSSTAKAGTDDIQTHLAHVQISQSPYKACKGLSLIQKSDFDKDKDFWTHAIQDCHVQVQVLPDTGFINTVLEKLGETEDQKKSVDLLKNLGTESLNITNLNIEMTDLLIHCAKKDKAWFANQKKYKYSVCGALITAVKEKMNSVRPDLRQDLALIGLAKRAYSSFGLDDPNRISPTLKEAQSMGGVEMEELSLNEQKEAQQQYISDNKALFTAWEAYKNQCEASIRKATNEFESKRLIQDQCDNPEAKETFLLNKLKDRARAGGSYLTQYQKDLNRALILNYLKDKEPNLQQIATAAEKLQLAQLRYKAFLEKSLNNLAAVVHLKGSKPVYREKPYSDQVKILSPIIKNDMVVNSYLGQHPENCEVATGIANYVQGQNIRNGVLDFPFNLIPDQYRLDSPVVTTMFNRIAQDIAAGVYDSL